MRTYSWKEPLAAAARRLGAIEAGGGAGDPTRAVDRDRRLHELDGIRGWAALAVVVFHLGYETFGVAFPAFRNDLTRTFNGNLAVYIFFVLSAEALSAPFFAGGGARAIASLAVKRHSRLSIPILALMLVVLALQHFDLVYAQPAAAIVDRPDWLGRFLAAPLGLAEALKYALLFVYLNPAAPGHLVPFLWTMTAEMLGSIFVFALLGVWDGLRRRERLLVVLILFFEATWATAFLSCFACGLLFGAWRTRGVFARWAAVPWRRALALLLILAALVAVDRAPIDDARLQSAAAMLLLGAIHASPGATGVFRAGPSRLLGKLSFPLYLVQFPVIVSLTSWLIVRAAAEGALTAGTALAIALGSLGATLVAAALFDPVELLTKRVGHALARAFVAPRGG